MLPNLLIVGAMRSGTTSAYRYLAEHPEIYMSPSKEPHYFAFEGAPPAYAGPGDDRLNARVTTTLSAYEGLFAAAGGVAWRGEASAMYLYLTHSVDAMLRHALDPMVIVILRNPTDRAYSSYQYMRRQGREPLESFEEALEMEATRVEANWSPMWHYRKAGLYADQVSVYLDAFGADRVRLLLYDDLNRDPSATFRSLFSDLGIRPDAPIDYSVQHNRSGTPRSMWAQRLTSRVGPVRRRAKQLLPVGAKHLLERLRESNIAAVAPMQPRTRSDLTEWFSEDVRRLEAVTGRDLSAWTAG